VVVVLVVLVIEFQKLKNLTPAAWQTTSLGLHSEDFKNSADVL